MKKSIFFLLCSLICAPRLSFASPTAFGAVTASTVQGPAVILSPSLSGKTTHLMVVTDQNGLIGASLNSFQSAVNPLTVGQGGGTFYNYPGASPGISGLSFSPAPVRTACASGSTVGNTGSLPGGWNTTHGKWRFCSPGPSTYCVDSPANGSTCMNAACTPGGCPPGSATLAPKQAGFVVDGSGNVVSSDF